jgi:uncharacterized protein (DUF927 family)/DNA primase
MASDSIFDKVKSRADIKEVVEHFGGVRFKGKLGRCPFPNHSDSNPSFSVEPTRNIFTCFGCGKTGDAVKFVSLIKEVEPLEAAKMLAAFYGIEDAPHGGYKRVDKVTAPKKAAQPDANLNAKYDDPEKAAHIASLYEPHKACLLRCHEATEPRDYLRLNRGFTDETIKRFYLGYDAVTDSITIPYSRRLDYYIYRLFNPPDPKKPYRKPDGNDWGGDRTFNIEALKLGGVVFVVESQLCAISIMQVGGTAVGLGGTSGVQRFLRDVKASGSAAVFIVALDNDPPGAVAQAELVAGLKKLGARFIEYNVAGGSKDPNELLQVDADALKANVAAAIIAAEEERNKVIEKPQTAAAVTQKPMDKKSKADEVKALLAADIDFDNLYKNAELIAALAYARNNLTIEYVEFKGRLKGKKSLNDFDAVIKQEAERLKKEQPAAAEGSITLSDCLPLQLDGIELNGAVLPPRYRMTMERGVARVVSTRDGGESEVIVCPHPIVITKVLTNIDDDSDGLEVKVCRAKKWKSIFGKRKQFSATQSIIEFADRGLRVTSSTASELINFLAAYETANPAAIPERISLDRLGWISDTEFYPFNTNTDVVFEVNNSSGKVLKNLRTGGSYDKWKDLARELRKNHYARFIISASFASPLLHKINCRTFVIHLWGDSTAGKTAVLKTAISAWGNIDSNGLMGNANATNVGLENFCATLKHLPFGVDEKQAASANKFDAETLIYMLSEGQGKVRGAKGGGNQDMLYWNNIVIFTGETSMTKSNTMDGAQNRILEIHERPVPDEQLGKLAHRVTASNYGHAGREFMAAIIQRLKESPDFLKEEYERILGIFAERNMTNAHSDYIAAVCLGDILLETVIFGTDIETAKKEALEVAMTIYQNNKAQLRGSVNSRAYDFILGWLMSNQNKFNRTAMDNIANWGRYENRGETAYFDDYYVIPSYVEDALTAAGYDIAKSTKHFLEKKLLIPTYKRDGTFERATKKERVASGQAPIATYHFRVIKNEPPPVQGKLELTPIEVEELPFKDGELPF